MRHVNLVFHAMSVRKQLIYDHNEGKHVGYVNFGGLQVDHHKVLATEALVFQVVSLKVHFKCVIAYFFID